MSASPVIFALLQKYPLHWKPAKKANFCETFQTYIPDELFGTDSCTCKRSMEQTKDICIRLAVSTSSYSFLNPGIYYPFLFIKALIIYQTTQSNLSQYSHITLIVPLLKIYQNATDCYIGSDGAKLTTWLDNNLSSCLCGVSFSEQCTHCSSDELIYILSAERLITRV